MRPASGASSSASASACSSWSATEFYGPWIKASFSWMGDINIVKIRGRDVAYIWGINNISVGIFGIPAAFIAMLIAGWVSQARIGRDAGLHRTRSASRRDRCATSKRRIDRPPRRDLGKGGAQSPALSRLRSMNQADFFWGYLPFWIVNYGLVPGGLGLRRALDAVVLRAGDAAAELHLAILRLADRRGPSPSAASSRRPRSAGAGCRWSLRSGCSGCASASTSPWRRLGMTPRLAGGG